MILQSNTLHYHQRQMAHKGVHKVHETCIVCTLCEMQKGTCETEATSNGEKIKPKALTIIELCLSEGISQESQSVENSTESIFFKIL